MKNFIYFFLIIIIITTSISTAFGTYHDYKIDEKGRIFLFKETSDTFDRLIAVANKKEKVVYSKNGLPLQHYIQLDKSVIGNMLSMKELHYGKKYTGLKIDFDAQEAEAQRVFEFLADNTQIEWSLLTFKIDGESRAHIYTSFESTLEYFGASKVFCLLRTPHVISSIKHYHNHPRSPYEAYGKYAFPSDEDIDFRDHLLKRVIDHVDIRIRTEALYIDYTDPTIWYKGKERFSFL